MNSGYSKKDVLKSRGYQWDPDGKPPCWHTEVDEKILQNELEFLKKEIYIPIDTFVSRGIELLNSVPRLILIITITSVVARSIWIVMIIIGITVWTRIARFTRAELLRIRSL